MRKPAIATLAVMLISTRADANIYMPSFIQYVTAPLLWSIYLITLVFTIPVVLVIGFIEALVVRRYAKSASLLALTAQMAGLNALTSLVGVYALPTGTELWPGLLIAFIITVPLEAFLLGAFFRRALAPPSVARVLRISLWMNTASYALLTCVLVGLIYIPLIGQENRDIRAHLSGTLVMARLGRIVELNFNGRAPKLSPEQKLDVESAGDYQARDDRTVAATSPDGKLFRLVRSAQGWRAESRVVHSPAKTETIVGVSLDGALICCTVEGRWMVRDTRRNKCIYASRDRAPEWASAAFSPDGRFVVLRGAAHGASLVDLGPGRSSPLQNCGRGQFSPDSKLLAWVDGGAIRILNCATGRSRRLRVPGQVTSDGMAWSPDGKHIAYLGHPNPFTAQRWTPDVRVVSVRDGGSVTLYPRLFTAGAPCPMVWLR